MKEEEKRNRKERMEQNEQKERKEASLQQSVSLPSRPLKLEGSWASFSPEKGQCATGMLEPVKSQNQPFLMDPMRKTRYLMKRLRIQSKVTSVKEGMSRTFDFVTNGWRA